MALVLGVVCIGALTFLMRAAFLAPNGRATLPPQVEHAMRFVPPAVLMALVVPDLVGHTGSLDLSLANPRLIAGMVAFVVAWRTRQVAPTLISGMATLWLLTFIFSR